MTAQISPPIPAHFEQSYQRLLNCLKLGVKQCFTNDERASCAKRSMERGVVSPLDR